MKQYTLTGQDIRVLIGAAANEFCKENDFPEEGDVLVMNMAAEISSKVCNHLSGEKEFPAEVISFLRMLDNKIIENAPTQAGEP